MLIFHLEYFFISKDDFLQKKSSNFFLEYAEVHGNWYGTSFEFVQSKLNNGDMIKITTSKKISPSLHWLTSSKTGKARASIRKHWQGKLSKKDTDIKEYTSTLSIDLPHKPGILGKVSTLIGVNEANIVNVELKKRGKEYLKFLFDIQIKDLKNFTNLISQIKQKNLNFKIIRHKQKKNAFLRRIFENFKRN